MCKNRANELTVKLREVFGDKSKLRFSENPKITIAIVGLQSLAGGVDKHSHLKKDRSLDEKSNDLFMYKFIFSNKNDVNWKKSC